jgi:type III restriction enzyme
MMLNEGWDVKNVSVIVPLRAFESNILVEQTLGRGLRRMFPENDQLEEKLIVVEHPRFKEMWEAEIKEKELDIEVGKVQDVPEPNKIEVDEEKMDHDFEIPIVQGGITKEVPDLSELNISNLDQEAFVFDDVDEYDPQYVEKDLKTKETTERRDIQFSYADRHQEYLSYVTRGILRKAGSSSQFSDLLPSVKTYIENFLFDQQIEIDGPEVLKKLNRPHIRNKIVDEFVKELNNLSTVESKYRIKSDYRLSNTDPIHTSRDVIEADKTVFNALPYDSSLEKRFMVFLDNEDTVHSYTKILPQFPMRIPYYDEDGILRHYLSDFVVKMGEERFFLIETKGGGFGEMKSVKLKDRAAKKWCERVSDISGTHWTYAKIMQEDFERNKGLGLHELLNTS